MTFVKQWCRFIAWFAIGVLTSLWTSFFLLERSSLVKLAPPGIFRQFDLSIILLLFGLCLAIPRIPGLRIHYRHLWSLKKLVFVPPIWLGLFGGLIVGSCVGFIKYYGEGYEWILLAIPVLIIVLKNSVGSNKQKKQSNKECIALPLNSFSKCSPSIDAQEIMTRYEALKNWYLQEQSSVNFIDLTGVIDKAQQIANLWAETKGVLRIGIVGEFGAGKSTLINFILNHLRKIRLSQELIVCKVSMWGCHTSLAAQELVLDGILEETAYHFDNSFFSSITNDWKELVEGSGFGWGKWFKFLWSNQTIEQKLQELSDVLRSLSCHLLLIIEDIDRNNDRDYDARQVQALLERLKSTLGCSIIVAGKADAIDFSRLCETLVTPPVISAYTLQDIISIVARHHVPQAFSNWSSTNTIWWSLLYGSNRSKNSIGSAAASLETFSILDFQQLVGTPRQLKHFLRRLDTGWNRLHGEANYFDFFLITLLRTSLPESFDFIHTHHEILQNPPKQEIKHVVKTSPTQWETLKVLFDKQRQKLDSKATCFDKVIALLFGNDVCRELNISVQLNPRSWPIRTRQGVAQGLFPTNYWNRIYSESVDSAEIKDQEIINAHEKWCLKLMNNNGLITLLRDESANLKWVNLNLGETLSAEQVLQMTTEILVDRCLDMNGTPLTVTFTPLAEMSAKSTLMVLANLVQRKNPKDSDAFWDWVVSTYNELHLKNMQAAVLFIKEWVIGSGQYMTTLSPKRYHQLKGVLSRRPEMPNGLMALIPKDSHQTLALYLLHLSLTEADLQTPGTFFAEHIQKTLVIPKWIRADWVQEIFNETTRKQALLQALNVLFYFRFELGHVQLIDTRISPVFGTYGRQIIELITETDLSTELPIESLKKIQEAAITWLNNNPKPL